MRSVWLLAQTCACADAHASIPRAAVLLENTHLHPSYKVAVVTRAFQPLIDESGPNKRLRRSNPAARFMAAKATRFLGKFRDDKIARRWRSGAANGDLAAAPVSGGDISGRSSLQGVTVFEIAGERERKASRCIMGCKECFLA